MWRVLLFFIRHIDGSVFDKKIDERYVAFHNISTSSNQEDFHSFMELSAKHPYYANPAQVPLQVLAAQAVPATTPPPPTPPPALDPRRDYQPYDTAVGSFLMTQFASPVTATPPPTQKALDLAYGCPALLEFPSSVLVEAPNGCETARFGKWRDPAENPIMSWNEVCTPNIQISTSPIIRYTLPNGDIFGYSREIPFSGGKSVELLDCGLRRLFRVDEHLVRDDKATIGSACERYGSCDGAIYTQFHIYEQGSLVASTPYLTLFQDSFGFTSPGGVPIAQITRVGGWTPREQCPDWSQTWLITMSPGAPTPFNDVTMRWPIAEALTMFSLRDQNRRNDGTVPLSLCEYKDGGIMFAVTCAIVAILLSATAIFYFFFFEALLNAFIEIEKMIFPPKIQQKFDPWSARGTQGGTPRPEQRTEYKIQQKIDPWSARGTQSGTPRPEQRT